MSSPTRNKVASSLHSAKPGFGEPGPAARAAAPNRNTCAPAVGDTHADGGTDCAPGNRGIRNARARCVLTVVLQTNFTFFLMRPRAREPSSFVGLFWARFFFYFHAPAVERIPRNGEKRIFCARASPRRLYGSRGSFGFEPSEVLVAALDFRLLLSPGALALVLFVRRNFCGS